LENADFKIRLQRSREQRENVKPHAKILA
jgi:hypothetical protein